MANSTDSRPHASQISALSQARRRLLRGGSAPVLMSLMSPAVAAECVTGSALTSASTSATNVIFTQCGGQLPAFWMSASNPWPAGLVKKGTNRTMFKDLFVGTTLFADKSLLEVLQFVAPTAPTPTERQVAAAWLSAAILNARAGLTAVSVIGEAVVLRIWAQFSALGYYEPTGGIRWTAYTTSPPVGASTGGLVEWLKTTMQAQGGAKTAMPV